MNSNNTCCFFLNFIFFLSFYYFLDVHNALFSFMFITTKYQPDNITNEIISKYIMLMFCSIQTNISKTKLNTVFKCEKSIIDYFNPPLMYKHQALNSRYPHCS